MQQNTWAIVLAAGEGSRLRSLTTDSSGVAVPKQFCSLQGGSSLLEETLRRAQSVVARERVTVIVAQQHRRWWKNVLWRLPTSNVVVQPRNRGTANGILLPVLRILARDPLARIAFLPADHYVRDERTLARSLSAALAELSRRPTDLVLLGVSPDVADPELGYIVPRSAHQGSAAVQVERFVEKPDASTARQLIEAGALWNSFIFAAHGFAVLSLLRRRHPLLVDRMETALSRNDEHALSELYEELPDIDFSRHIAQDAEESLRVLAVPSCGWNDLGTPQRVTETLRRIPEAQRARHSNAGAYLNLAAAARVHLQLAG
ncbi:MAG TPA: sugar phosphate nucleotidyltransferase [Steroidobacteraceae bacterium]|nr:sugar phosphate nucleotidyltransferase [Steroidobacteraceae bacterium]